MYTLKSIEFGKKNQQSKTVITIFYFSDPHGTGEIKNHCEIFKANEISRFILNQSAITLKFNDERLKLSVRENWDLKPLIELVDLVTGSGLQVVQHFSTFRDMSNFKKKD